MTRQEKYPETSTFHYYNANPYNRFTTDCVIRAICTALEMPYNIVLMEMAQLQCETGYDSRENKLIDLYLKSKGWVKHKQPRKADNTKYTGVEFCKAISKDIFSLGKSIVANIGGGHIVCIKPIGGSVRNNHKVHDTWDSTDGCIGIYWTKA